MKPEPPDNATEPLWTVEEVATYLRVSPSWIYRAVALGKLPHTRIGALVRFSPAAIRKFAATSG